MYINKIHILGDFSDIFLTLSTSYEYVGISVRNNRQHIQTRRKPYDDREKSVLMIVNYNVILSAVKPTGL